MARELAVWFQRSFGNDRKFDPGPFVPPAEPRRAEATLHAELERLRQDVAARAKELEAAQPAIGEAKKIADAELLERTTAESRDRSTPEQRAAKAREDAAIWEALANEQIDAHRETAKAAAAKSQVLEEHNRRLLAELAAAQAMPPKQLALTIERAADASAAIQVDEAATRKLIDRQLRDAGWEVDSEQLKFARRPADQRKGPSHRRVADARRRERGLGRLRPLRRAPSRRRRRGEAKTQ